MGSGKNGRYLYAQLVGIAFAGMILGGILYELIGVYLVGESKVPFVKALVIGVCCSFTTALTFYQAQMKLTDEEWEAVKKTREEARKREIREDLERERPKHETPSS